MLWKIDEITVVTPFFTHLCKKINTRTCLLSRQFRINLFIIQNLREQTLKAIVWTRKIRINISCFAFYSSFIYFFSYMLHDLWVWIGCLFKHFISNGMEMKWFPSVHSGGFFLCVCLQSCVRQLKSFIKWELMWTVRSGHHSK